MVLPGRHKPAESLSRQLGAQHFKNVWQEAMHVKIHLKGGATASWRAAGLVQKWGIWPSHIGQLWHWMHMF